MLTDAIMYRALVDKDVSYEGTFFAAVKTTGIFCRPTCTARKPKMENVEYFKTTKDAILHGYRPCKVCNDSFKSVFGVSPSNSKDKQIINITRLETLLGTMFACAVEQGICLLEFSDRRMLETELKLLAKLLNATIIQSAHHHLNMLDTQLNEYFEGKRKVFSVQLFTPGTNFQQTVWHELQLIPYGTTRSYRQQAIAIKKPEAIRAVGSANGMNRISILIPCHRVIGADGNLTGYGGGIWRKKWLLDFEKDHL